MNHNPLESTDAALLLIRDLLRRNVARQAQRLREQLAKPIEPGPARDRFVRQQVARHLSVMVESASKARVAWSCVQDPSGLLIDAASAAVVALSYLCTPEAIHRALAEQAKRLERTHPAPPEGRKNA